MNHVGHFPLQSSLLWRSYSIVIEPLIYILSTASFKDPQTVIELFIGHNLHYILKKSVARYDQRAALNINLSSELHQDQPNAPKLQHYDH